MVLYIYIVMIYVPYFDPIYGEVLMEGVLQKNVKR